VFSNADTAKLNELDELRLSTAFANLANTDVDVIAIATSHSVDEIEVIVSTNHHNIELIEPSLPIKITDIWRVIFSPNPRTDDTRADTGDQMPFIASTKIPRDVVSGDLKTLQNYIENIWCVDCHDLHGICSLLT
jgi:hypothetical protein